MADWPEEARVAAIKAIDATGVLVTAPMAMRLATDILDAVTPLLAGAWGAFECEPLRTDDIERLRGIEAMGRIIAYVESLPCNSGMLCGRCAALGREPHA